MYPSEDDRFIQLRNAMVLSQIEARDVRDPAVLDAMRNVPRHRFVPSNCLDSAYDDSPLPIGFGQTISQPYIVALMTELCCLTGREKVLEIGTGSGYQAAVLSQLCSELFTVERIHELHLKAQQILTETGCSNVHLKEGDGFSGWKEESPFDVIMLTACPAEIPDELFSQLKDGGILVAPEGREVQKLIRARRTGTTIEKETITYVRFVEMIRSKT